MKHSDMEALISAYANGELHRTQREFAEEHLASCADCRSDLADNTWVRSELTSLKATPVGTNIKEATMLKIEAIHTVRRPVLGILRPALVATAIAGAIIAALVLQLPTDDPSGPIAKAYAATAGLTSYRMSGSTTYTGNGESAEIALEWEFVAPDRYHGKLTTQGDIQEFIIIGDQQYARDSGSGQSRGTVFVMTEGVFSPVPSREGTLQLLDSLIDLAELPDEIVASVDSLHYRGTVDIDRIVDEQAAKLDVGAPGYEADIAALNVHRRIQIHVELWISKSDHSIQKLRQDVQSPTVVSDAEGTRVEGSVGYSTVVRYFDLDEPIEIGRPLTPSGALEPGWRQTSAGQPAPATGTSEVN